MQLVLVRHAEAAPGEPDELRPLTGHGRQQARRLGVQLRADGLTADIVLSSPLLRARQTAALIAGELGADLRVAEELAPGASAEDVARAVRQAAPALAVVAVGHQPDCSRIAAALTGEAVAAFPPAASVLIELRD